MNYWHILYFLCLGYEYVDSAPVKTSFYDAIEEKCPAVKSISTYKDQNLFKICGDWKTVSTVDKFTGNNQKEIRCLLYFDAFTRYCTGAKKLETTLSKGVLVNYNLETVCDYAKKIPNHNLSTIFSTGDNCQKICGDELQWVESVCGISYYFAQLHSIPDLTTTISKKTSATGQDDIHNQKLEGKEAQTSVHGEVQEIKQAPPQVDTGSVLKNLGDPGINGQAHLNSHIGNANDNADSPARDPATGGADIPAHDPATGSANVPAHDPATDSADPNNPAPGNANHDVAVEHDATAGPVSAPEQDLNAAHNSGDVHNGPPQTNVLTQGDVNANPSQKKLDEKKGQPKIDNKKENPGEVVGPPVNIKPSAKDGAKTNSNQEIAVDNQNQHPDGPENHPAAVDNVNNQNKQETNVDNALEQNQAVQGDTDLESIDDDSQLPPDVVEEDNVNSPDDIAHNDKSSKPQQVDDTEPVNYATEMEGDSYFFTYFMLLCIIFIVGYVCYHNKQKILALILEGRRGKRQYRGRRPNSANYHKLDSNLEEAITSSCKKNTNNVIY